LECCNNALFSATCGHFATERKDSQNIYIILGRLQFSFGLGDLSIQ